jgi:perosamine synthetase
MSVADAPVNTFIPLCVPEIRGNEWAYVKECLDTTWVSSVGSYVDRFEREVAQYVGVKHAVATVNGTSALHLALLVAGVQPDDEVLVSTLTFIAPVNAIRYAGAWPVLIDAEPDYWQMDPVRVAEFLEEGCERLGGELRNKRTGRRVKAIIPVHILGHPVEMDPVVELARSYGLSLIEDATESLGAEYRGRKVGRIGESACLSFNGNKLLTTGGGGMLLTDDPELARKAKHLSTQAKYDPIEYVHDEIGFNYRLTNLQAAMGCAQLEQIEPYIEAKRRIAERYTDAFEGVRGISVMRQAPWASSVFWMFTVLVDPEEYGEDSRTLLRRLGDVKIQTRPLWQPIHQSGPYRECQSVGGAVAERLNQQALSLPCSVGLTEAEQTRVIDAIRRGR